MKFRKHSATNLSDLAPLSTMLRSARDHIQRHDFAAALTMLNNLLAGGGLDNTAQARIISFVADSELVQGNYADAASSYQLASTLLSSHPRAWLRPAMGQVIDLLRNAQPDLAIANARLVVQTAVSVHSLTPALTVAPQSRTAVAARPWAADTVATRLAKQFLAEGELAAAKELLASAQALNPTPTLYTCLALADVAEREDRLADAATLAKQALSAGGYGAKTLSAWPLLLRINMRLGIPGVDPTLLQALQQAQASVQARAVLLISRTLRSQNVVQWLQLANDWLASDQADDYPRVTAEFNKLLLSSQRLKGTSPDDEIATASELQATPLVSPMEYLFAMKEQVRVGCFPSSSGLSQTNASTGTPGWQKIVDQMVLTYGEHFRARATHSVALSYMMGQRHDLARPVLEANIAAVDPTKPEWAKSVSALARMERFLGNHVVAAQWFWQLSQNAAVPARFQLRALLSWVKETVLSASTAQSTAALARARPQLQSAIAQLQDYNVLLDLGRQLTFAPVGLKDLADAALNQGVPLAQGAFTQAPDASSAAVILAKLAQRQSDLRRYADVTAFWETLSAEKKNWLWSTKEEFWTYLTLVFQAYDNSANGAAAESLATTYLGDAAMPPAAVPILAIPYGLFQMRTNRTGAALQTFAWAVSKSPSTSSTAAGYYWLALSAWKSGDRSRAAALAGNLLLALGQHADKLMDHGLQGKALLIQAGLDPNNVSVQAVNFNAATLNLLAAAIQSDLQRLR